MKNMEIPPEQNNLMEVLQMRRRLRIIDEYRFYECCMALLLIVLILLFSGFKNNNYKNNSIELTKEQQKFVNEWNGLPSELREWIDEYEEEGFVALDVPLSKELQLHVFNMCKKYNMDFVYVMAVIQTESSFQIDAKCKNQNNKYYSIGLLQLNEKYIEEFKTLTGNKKFDINNPYDNIEGGVAKLSQLHKQWSKYDLSEESMWYAVLNSYNKGYSLYKSEVISRGGFFSRSYDQKVFRNKEKLEGGVE